METEGLEDSIFTFKFDERAEFAAFQAELNAQLQQNQENWDPNNEAVLRRRLSQQNGGSQRVGEVRYLKTRVGKLEFEQTGDCAICMTTFDVDDVISILGCHKTHVLHTDCLQSWTANR